MASQLHTYTVHTRWSGGREGSGSIQNDNSGKGYDIKVPTEFGGPGGELNPEELLTDAIAGCYSITYGIVAANRRIPVKSIEVQSVGTVDQSGANFVYKSVALSPKITLAADATDQDIATAVDMAHKADAYCIVTNAVRGKVEVSITPSVQREGQETQGAKPVSGDQTLNASFTATAATTVTGNTASASSDEGNSAGVPASNAAPGAITASGSAQPDTAPKDETSYQGSQADEDAYPVAGDAEKPSTATPEAGESGAGGTTSGDSTGTSGANNTGSDGTAGVPKNAESDSAQASSEQTGDPETMQVGSVPG